LVGSLLYLEVLGGLLIPRYAYWIKDISA